MRASGILLPVFSLPGRYGIGGFTKEAYKFVDFLKAAGQKYWQILPLGPTGYGDSPYQSFSTFAGNPYFIDVDEFVKEGFLREEECWEFDATGDDEYIDYEKLYFNRFKLLRGAPHRKIRAEKNPLRAVFSDKLGGSFFTGIHNTARGVDITAFVFQVFKREIRYGPAAEMGGDDLQAGELAKYFFNP